MSTVAYGLHNELRHHKSKFTIIWFPNIPFKIDCSSLESRE